MFDDSARIEGKTAKKKKSNGNAMMLSLRLDGEFVRL